MALAELSAGDQQWWAGERGAAQSHWRRALAELTDLPADRAAEAMARMRLLQVSGNLGPFWLERPMERALNACPESEPWCAIAQADAQLWLPPFTGADPQKVPALLAHSPLTGPASARLALALHDASRLSGELDGMGEGIREHGLNAPNPGTWVLTVGLGAAPGAGIGGALHFDHPDLGFREHRLRLVLGGDSRGGFSGSFSLLFHLRPAPLIYLVGARSITDFYLGNQVVTVEQGVAIGGAGLYWTFPGWTLGVGGQTRWDNLGTGWEGNHGPWLSLNWAPVSSFRWSQRAEGGLGDYDYLLLQTDLRWYPSLAGGTLGLHSGASWVPTDTPVFRLPSAGGAELLRGQPAGRYRDRLLIPLQFEYRHPIVGPLQAAVFGDLAWIGGPHWSVGGGLRLVLPPEALNVTRVDVGYGEGSWGVVVGWGQAF